MSQSFEPTTVFSTLFMNQFRRKPNTHPDVELPVPELRHAEAVLRRMLRRQGETTEPVTERVQQAAAVISNGLLRTESMVLSGCVPDGKNRTRSVSDGPRSGIGEIQCASRRRHIASRLAKRVVQSMTRSVSRCQ